MNNDTKGKKVLFIPTANIDEETKFLVDEAKGVFKKFRNGSRRFRNFKT